MNTQQMTTNERAEQWLDEGYLFLDTETTGLNNCSE